MIAVQQHKVKAHVKKVCCETSEEGCFEAVVSGRQ
jgi:hypothetical protein